MEHNDLVSAGLFALRVAVSLSAACVAYLFRHVFFRALRTGALPSADLLALGICVGALGNTVWGAARVASDIANGRLYATVPDAWAIGPIMLGAFIVFAGYTLHAAAYVRNVYNAGKPSIAWWLAGLLTTWTGAFVYALWFL